MISLLRRQTKALQFVVMNTTDYLREGYRQLQDTNFYQKLDKDPIPKLEKEKICKILTEMRDPKIITEKNFENLNIQNATPGRFYLFR